jgi:hypothetical protein
MIAEQSTRVRLSKRPEAVEGPEQIPGQALKCSPIADPRTANQDSIIKPKGLMP